MLDSGLCKYAKTADAPAFRFFEVRGPKAVLRLDALTLRGGRASAGAAGKSGGDGGAIYVYGGTLAITDVTFSGNRAGRGGDARAPAIHGGKGGSGGAIYVRYQAVALTITRSIFTGVLGRESSAGTCAIFTTTGIPSTTWPKIEKPFLGGTATARP